MSSQSHPKIVFDQLSGHLVTQSGQLLKLTLTITFSYFFTSRLFFFFFWIVFQRGSSEFGCLGGRESGKMLWGGGEQQTRRPAQFLTALLSTNGLGSYF